jgi:hypothetical protein
MKIVWISSIVSFLSLLIALLQLLKGASRLKAEAKRLEKINYQELKVVIEELAAGQEEGAQPKMPDLSNIDEVPKEQAIAWLANALQEFERSQSNLSIDRGTFFVKEKSNQPEVDK